MTRAKGKHDTGREPVIADSGEGRAIGMSERTAGATSPIPGGDIHITNAPTVRQKVPIPDPQREYRGILAHGVPIERHTTHERAAAEQGPNTAHGPAPAYQPPPSKPASVPVHVVETRKIRTLATDSYTIPAAGTAAVRIAGRSYNRSAVQLLVETAAGAAGAAPTGIRIDHEVGNIDAGKGALLRAGATSYLQLDCNDELFAVSNDGSACTLSVIYLYGIAETG